MVLPKCLSVALVAFVQPAVAAFGYTQTRNSVTVDAGSNNPLIFSVSRSSCDLTSIKYRGHELQYPDTGSHLGSGLGSASVSVSENGDVIEITCVAAPVTHYMFAKKGDAAIYMATHIQDNSFGELRFIARMNNDILTDEHPFGNASSYAGTSAIVEGSDVVLVNGRTRSKFYSAQRYIDRGVPCIYGSSPERIHVCMLMPNPESSSGGPFFRDIETSNSDDYNSIHNYMWSAHTQIEATQRVGLHGPYAIVFSSNGVPRLDATDFSFFDNAGCKGYVPKTGRGYVSGQATGIPAGYEAVIHWYNDNAQYWARAGSNGQFTSPAMKPGTYTMVLYQTEYKAAQTTVTLSSGRTTSKSIASPLAEEVRNTLFKIGRYDGRPSGFRNADKIEHMHPSDARMSRWQSSYTVGQPSVSDFPMAIFMDVNDGTPIYFNLASVPNTATLRVATTLSFSAARPRINVNDWEGEDPGAPERLDSRGVTRGVYRGYGEQYDLPIPAGVLKKGANTIKLYAVAGSSDEGFLNSLILPIMFPELTFLWLDVENECIRFSDPLWVLSFFDQGAQPESVCFIRQVQAAEVNRNGDGFSLCSAVWKEYVTIFTYPVQTQPGRHYFPAIFSGLSRDLGFQNVAAL